MKKTEKTLDSTKDYEYNYLCCFEGIFISFEPF